MVEGDRQRGQLSRNQSSERRCRGTGGEMGGAGGVSRGDEPGQLGESQILGDFVL